METFHGINTKYYELAKMLQFFQDYINVHVSDLLHELW